MAPEHLLTILMVSVPAAVSRRRGGVSPGTPKSVYRPLFLQALSRLAIGDRSSIGKRRSQDLVVRVGLQEFDASVSVALRAPPSAPTAPHEPSGVFRARLRRRQLFEPGRQPQGQQSSPPARTRGGTLRSDVLVPGAIRHTRRDSAANSRIPQIPPAVQSRCRNLDITGTAGHI